MTNHKTSQKQHD